MAKLTREFKAAINRRAHQIAADVAVDVSVEFAKLMREEVELDLIDGADDLADFHLERPPEWILLVRKAASGELRVVCNQCGEPTRLNQVVGEVAGACEHCYGMPLEPGAGMAPADVCADAGFDATDHLAGF